jgi:uncharacterized membrane protein
MPFCATCGAQVEGRFCAKCGSAVAAAPGAAPVAPGPQPMIQPGSATYGAMADNVASALCYALGLVTGIIFLVIAPYNQNRTVRFHAFQSIFMHVGLIAIWIALNIVFGIVFRIISVFALLGAVIFPVLGLACFILWLYLLISAYQGKMVMLPIIGPIALKQANS